MSERGESVCTACILPPCTVKAVGVVESVGDGVVSVSQGDFVILATHGTNRFTVGGKTVYHLWLLRLLGIHVDCGDLRRQNSTCCGPEPGLPLRLWCLHRLWRRVKEVASVPAEAAVEPEVVSVTADAAVEREVATVPAEVAVEPEAVEPLVVEPEAAAVVQASTVESEVAVPQKSKDEPEAVAPVEVQRWNPKSPP